MTGAWRKTAASGVVALGVLVVNAYWPHSSPAMIHVKAKLFGPQFVFGELWSYHDRWEAVIAGVTAGDSPYLRTAVELYPALDGEAAYDMVGAVSAVIERNPEGAISTLLPKYGAGVVCGSDGVDAKLSPQVATRRLRAVQSYAQSTKSTPDLIACMRAAEATANMATGVEESPR
jgi:hypothetical protein